MGEIRASTSHGRGAQADTTRWTSSIPVAVGPGGHTHQVTSGPNADDRQHAAVPWRTQLRSVTGRRAQGGSRGLPAIDRVSFETPDGTKEFGPPGRGDEDTLKLLAEIKPGSFQRAGAPSCPICIDGDPTDREHVPQRNLGGHVMTMTCKACNNGLGSRVEAALQDWFDFAYRRVAFEHEEILGRRHIPTIYHRQAADGTFAWLVDGELTPEVKQMLTGGELDMHYRPPNQRRYSLALLKHAYLAACLHLKVVPDTKVARATRADLVDARDAIADEQLPVSEPARRIKVYRSHIGRQGPPLALVAKQDPNGEIEPEVLISLAGVLFVTWPLSDISPVT